MEYIHPNDKAIIDFAKNISQGSNGLKDICEKLLSWFDENISYSRMNAPFFPLQRSDLDVLEMRSGTCGDFSNLLVSVLSALNFDARYAYVHRDCYGDEQDHISVAVKEGNKYILVDATQPYRKWYGYDCPHWEYDLLTPQEFERKMKDEEAYWTAAAQRLGNPLYAGLLYAPWIHSQCVINTDDRLDDIFFLLSIGNRGEPTLYAYYQHYSMQEHFIPVMAKIDKGGASYHFSVHAHSGIWDDAQWSQAYSENSIRTNLLSAEFIQLKQHIAKMLNRLNPTLLQIDSSCFI